AGSGRGAAASAELLESRGEDLVEPLEPFAPKPCDRAERPFGEERFRRLPAQRRLVGQRAIAVEERVRGSIVTPSDELLVAQAGERAAEIDRGRPRMHVVQVDERRGS